MSDQETEVVETAPAPTAIEVPEKVLKGIRAMRKRAKDHDSGVAEADEGQAARWCALNEHPEAATWIRANPYLYVQGLEHGFKAA